MIQLMSEGDISMAPEEIEIGKKLYGVMSDPKNSALKASILDVIQAGGRPSMEALSKIPGLTPRDEAYLVGLNARALSDVTAANPKLMTAQAAMDRNTIYSQKIAIGESIKSIDAEMNRMTSEFPALRKIPTIDVDLLRAPSQPSAQPSGSVPGGPPVSAFPATRTTAPGGAVVAPASNVPESPVSDSHMSRIPGIETASPEFMGPPNLPGTVSAFQSRAKELAGADRRSGELAVDPLLIPLYQNIGAATGMRPEQVGASRFSVTVPDLVRRNLDASLGNFAALPPDVQNRAMLDAITKSYQEPQARRPLFGWQYESPFGR